MCVLRGCACVQLRVYVCMCACMFVCLVGMLHISQQAARPVLCAPVRGPAAAAGRRRALCPYPHCRTAPAKPPHYQYQATPLRHTHKDAPRARRPTLEGGAPRHDGHVAGLLARPCQLKGVQVRLPGGHLHMEERERPAEVSFYAAQSRQRSRGAAQCSVQQRSWPGAWCWTEVRQVCPARMDGRGLLGWAAGWKPSPRPCVFWPHHTTPSRSLTQPALFSHHVHSSFARRPVPTPTPQVREGAQAEGAHWQHPRHLHAQLGVAR